MKANHEMSINQSFISELKKKAAEVNAEDKFVDYFFSHLSAEDNKGTVSKRRYFRIEGAIIFLSFFSGSLMTYASSVKIADNRIYQLMTFAVILASYGVTALMAYRGLRNYYETWQRHRNYVNKSIEESIKYLNNTGDYSSLSKEDALNKYKEKMIELREQTNRAFEKNMQV